jgi:hypothetical protein
MDSEHINSSMTNIIKFPSTHIKASQQDFSSEEKEASLQREKIIKIEEALEFVSTESIGMVYRMGFDITREDYVKDVTLIVDSLRSLMYRTMNMEHPIHVFVDKNYKMVDSEEGEYAFSTEWHDPEDKLD